jgi:hypothetical protein
MLHFILSFPSVGRIALCILFFLSIRAEAQPKIIRGPYLNSVTSTSAVIRWRTDHPTDSKVCLSTTLNNVDCQKSVSDPALVADHELLVSGLSPVTQYFYTVGGVKETAKTSPQQYLKTAPAIGSTGPVRIWALGDFGNSSKNQSDCLDAIMNTTTDHRPDVWIWLGDNAYDKGRDSEYQEHVFRVYQERLFANTTFFPSPGNHDYGDAKYDGRDIPYFKIFTLPQHGEAGGVPSGSEAYYSVDYGNVHLVSLDSQGKLDGGFKLYDTLGSQVGWLKKDLANNKLPWTIVYFHHSPYSLGSHSSDKEEDLVKLRRTCSRSSNDSR